MSKTAHSKHDRHIGKVKTRDAGRHQFRQSLALGDYDALPTRLPTRAVKTATSR